VKGLKLANASDGIKPRVERSGTRGVGSDKTSSRTRATDADVADNDAREENY